MKTENFVRTLILVVIYILIIQIFLSVSILILFENLNRIVVNIVSVLSIASAIVLSMFLVKLFELFTGKTFGEIYYRHYFWDQSKSSDNNDKILD
jgi:hypothetical protein